MGHFRLGRYSDFRDNLEFLNDFLDVYRGFRRNRVSPATLLGLFLTQFIHTSYIMKKTFHLMAAAALAGFATSVASAATIVQSQAYSFTPTGNDVLTFSKFNTNLGTLTAITITTELTKSGGSLFVDNDSVTPASGIVTQTITINLSSVNVALLTGDVVPQSIGQGVAAVSSYSATVGADDSDGGGYQAGGVDHDGTSFGSVFTSDSDNVGSTYFGGYSTAGAGTFNITAAGTQGIDISAIGGAAGTFTPSVADGNVIITYVYTAIPEPTTALLGALGVLGLLRRRR